MDNQPTEDPSLKHPKNPLEAMSKGEKTILILKRHPVGVIPAYAMFGLMIVLTAIGAIMAPDLFPNADRQSVANVGLIVFLLLSSLAGIFMYVAHTVYYGTRWILTTDSITQIRQMSLFSRQNSQLGLDNLEDVSVVQNGIFPHLFNYGVLRCQTAGEEGKFVFNYCPNPNKFARQILVARETFENEKVNKSRLV